RAARHRRLALSAGKGDCRRTEGGADSPSARFRLGVGGFPGIHRLRRRGGVVPGARRGTGGSIRPRGGPPAQRSDRRRLRSDDRRGGDGGAAASPVVGTAVISFGRKGGETWKVGRCFQGSASPSVLPSFVSVRTRP